ncbi:MAG: sensor histidine kinase [Paenibacillaceae bacterium]
MRKFSHKLIISYLVIIALVASPHLWIYLSYHRALEREIVKYADQILYQIGGAMDRVVEEIVELGLTIGGNQDIVDILNVPGAADLETYAKTRRILYNLIGYKSNIVSVTIFKDDGTSFSVGSTSTRRDYNFKNDVWYKELLQARRYMWPPHRQTHVIDSQAQEVFSMAGEIRDPITRNVIGYVLIDLSTREFDYIFNENKMIQNSSVYVLSHEGSVVYHSRQTVIPLEDIQSLLFGRRGQRGQMTGGEQNDMLVHYYTSERSDFQLAFAVPSAEIGQSVRDSRNWMIAGIVVSLAVAIVIAYALARRMTSPLQRLSRKIQSLEQGNFDVFITSRSQDEIGVVEKNFNQMVEEIKHLIERVYKTEILRKEAQFQALQAQINPHFLYNTLAAIDGIASINEQQEIVRITQALVRILRYSISGNNEATIEEEMQHVLLYLSIQKVRFGARIEHELFLDDSIKHVSMMKLLIQPLVENSIIHGWKHGQGALMISVKIEKHEDRVHVLVEDRGIGIKRDSLQEIRSRLKKGSSDSAGAGTRIGLQSVNERLKNRYGDDCEIHIASEYGVGTQVRFQIPLVAEERMIERESRGLHFGG